MSRLLIMGRSYKRYAMLFDIEVQGEDHYDIQSYLETEYMVLV
jgi:hypothetical protein